MTEYKVHRVRFISLQPRPINSAAVDTTRHNPRLALSREDGSIEIRDPTNMWITERNIPGQVGRTVEHLAWNDGRLFSGGLNGEIIEWDLEQLRPKYAEDSLGGPVWCIRFNHQKNYLAAGCEDGSIRIFKVLKEGLFYERSLYKQENRILSISWSHDDTKIVAGGFDSTIRIYDTQTGHITSRITTSTKEGTTSTMVWAVEILRDSTIVTGDSLGNTQFWDGNTGTLIASFHSHIADVLTLAVCDDEKKVYSSGVESKIVQFSLTEKGEGDKQWTIIRNLRPSNYDIRALAVCKGKEFAYLVAAGVDSSFMTYPLDNFKVNKLVRHTGLPNNDVCQLAPIANQIMYRSDHKVKIWQLEDTEELSTSCKKLIEIQSESDDLLVSSAISPCGSYLCYSTISKAKFFSIQPHPLKLTKVMLPLPPFTKVVFTADSKYLIGATFSKALHFVNIDDENTYDIDVGEFDVKLPIRLMETSANSKYLCFVDVTSIGFIFEIKENGLKFQTKLPKVDEAITSISFHPESNNVFVGTCFKKVYEFDILQEKFVPWLLALSKVEAFDDLGLHRHILRQVAINPLAPNEIFLQCQNEFGKLIYGSDVGIKLEKEEGEEEGEPPKKKKKKKKKRKVQTSDILKMTAEFRKVFHFSFNSKGELVIAERPPYDSTNAMPKPLKVKRFQHK